MMRGCDITMNDYFCGAGGSSTGALQTGLVRVRTAANHWDKALETHASNHAATRHVLCDLSSFNPRRIPAATIGWFSPECTHHSSARGKKRQEQFGPDLFGETLPSEAAERSRATMWDVPRFTEAHRYQAVIVENVFEVLQWVMFDAWLLAMTSMGYRYRIVSLNAMHAWAQGPAVGQSRDRVFIVFWKAGNRHPTWTACWHRRPGASGAGRWWPASRRGSRAGALAATVPSTCTSAGSATTWWSRWCCPPQASWT
jgi:DNA (cytosine-5)-methyltransferase 1